MIILLAHSQEATALTTRFSDFPMVILSVAKKIIGRSFLFITNTNKIKSADLWILLRMKMNQSGHLLPGCEAV